MTKPRTNHLRHAIARPASVPARIAAIERGDGKENTTTNQLRFFVKRRTFGQIGKGRAMFALARIPRISTVDGRLRGRAFMRLQILNFDGSMLEQPQLLDAYDPEIFDF